MPNYGSYGGGPDQTYWVIGIVLLIMVVRLVRGAKERRVRIETMWIGPAVFGLMAAWVIYIQPPPPSPLVYAVMVLAAVAGLGVGWLRARTTRITLNVEKHQLMSQVSPVGLIIFLVILLARRGLMALLGQHAQEWHIPAAALIDGPILFVAGMIIGRRLEIFLRCLNILKDAAAARAAGQSVSEVVTEDHA